MVIYIQIHLSVNQYMNKKIELYQDINKILNENIKAPICNIDTKNTKIFNIISKLINFICRK